MTSRDFEGLPGGPYTVDSSTGEVRDASGQRIARIEMGASGSRALARLFTAAPDLLAHSQELYDQVRWSSLGQNFAQLMHLQRLRVALEATRPHQPLVGASASPPTAPKPAPELREKSPEKEDTAPDKVSLSNAVIEPTIAPITEPFRSETVISGT